MPKTVPMAVWALLSLLEPLAAMLKGVPMAVEALPRLLKQLGAMLEELPVVARLLRGSSAPAAATGRELKGVRMAVTLERGPPAARPCLCR